MGAKGKSKPSSADVRLIALLGRMRLTVPFPVDPALVAHSLLPKIQSPEPHPCQLGNLKLSMELGSVVTISLDDERRYTNGDFEDVFWIHVPTPVPIPHDPTTPYRLWPENPYWKMVGAWYHKADALETKLEPYRYGFREYFSHISRASELRATWPELQQFVRLPGARMLHVSKEARRDLVEMTEQYFSAADRKKVIETLTAATLLDQTEPNAWVGYSP